MNVETGKIVEMSDNMAKTLNKKNKLFVPCDLSDLTSKQRRDMQVSKKDNRSKMGKYFRDLRAERKDIIRREREFRKGSRSK